MRCCVSETGMGRRVHSPAVSRNESLMGILSPGTTINCLWAEGRWSGSGACDTFARHCLCVFCATKRYGGRACCVLSFFVCLIFHFAFWSFGQGSKGPKMHFTVFASLICSPWEKCFCFHVAYWLASSSQRGEPQYSVPFPGPKFKIAR